MVSIAEYVKMKYSTLCNLIKNTTHFKSWSSNNAFKISCNDFYENIIGNFFLCFICLCVIFTEKYFEKIKIRTKGLDFLFITKRKFLGNTNKFRVK